MKISYSKKKALFLLLPLLFILFLIALVPRPQGFTLSKIHSHHAADPRWEIRDLTSLEIREIKSILSEPFTYLGSGNHTYAFQSHDGKYVLKFFKQKHMRSKIWQNYLPLPNKLIPSRNAKLQRFQEERHEAYTSYLIAYNHFAKDTGLFYLHLNKSKFLNQKILLIDQHGKNRTIDADRAEFLIQKRAEIGFAYLDRLFEMHQSDRVLQAMESLLKLVSKRVRLGIDDSDMLVYKNFGFCDGKAMQIDIGEFRLLETSGDPDIIVSHIYVVASQLREYLKKKAPHLLPNFDEMVDQTSKKV